MWENKTIDVPSSDFMKKLCEISTVVFLKVDTPELEKRLSNIRTRGVAMKKGTTIRQLHEERLPLYEKYADITLNCTGLTAEECVESIIGLIEE